MDLVYTITHSSRIHDLLFCRDNNRNENDGQLLLVGAEDRKVSVYRIYSGAHSSSSSVAAQPRVVAEMVGHTNRFAASHHFFFSQRTERFYGRIKGVETLEIGLPRWSSRSSTTIACTVSSDGYINVYDVGGEVLDEKTTGAEKSRTRIEPIARYDSKGTRFTCVALADGLDDVILIWRVRRSMVIRVGTNVPSKDKC